MWSSVPEKLKAKTDLETDRKFQSGSDSDFGAVDVPWASEMSLSNHNTTRVATQKTATCQGVDGCKFCGGNVTANFTGMQNCSYYILPL